MQFSKDLFSHFAGCYDNFTRECDSNISHDYFMLSTRGRQRKTGRGPLFEYRGGSVPQQFNIETKQAAQFSNHAFKTLPVPRCAHANVIVCRSGGLQERAFIPKSYLPRRGKASRLHDMRQTIPKDTAAETAQQSRPRPAPRGTSGSRRNRGLTPMFSCANLTWLEGVRASDAW